MIPLQVAKALYQTYCLREEAGEMPELTLDLFGKLIAWMEAEIAPQYWPVHNPDYNPEKEVRTDAPFVDLYRAYKEGKDIVELAHTD